MRYVDPKVDGTREPVTGRGQLNLPGPAGKGRPAFGPHGDRETSYVLKREDNILWDPS